MQARLRVALKTAMKARDAAAVNALRTALAAIDNAEAVAVPAPATGPLVEGVIAGAAAGVGATEVARRELTEDAVVAIVTAEVDERRAAAADYRDAGQFGRAARLTAEADALATHLPEPRS
jgi:uncharacterized protein YqeY